jgi:hypothetical protein
MLFDGDLSALVGRFSPHKTVIIELADEAVPFIAGKNRGGGGIPTLPPSGQQLLDSRHTFLGIDAEELTMDLRA